jgi:tRNA dimethylallyltransferase
VPPLPSIPIPVLTAPTASGKTALALALAQESAAAGRPVEIVAADAFTVYRGLDIGTAKPDAAERAAVPHHLMDVADVTEDYSVAAYARAAESAVADILARGAQPLVVGGTGFYLTALTRGLPLTPPADVAARAVVEAELEARGLDALLADIAAENPAEAARMERNPRRVVRALEIRRRTGRYPGEFGHAPPAFSYRVLAFSPPEPELLGRVESRTRAMLAGGWPEEALWLAAQVDPQREPRPTAWQALGYREAFAVARGELRPEEAAARIVLATRQYTRRQLTWTRRQLGAEVLSPARAEAHLRAALGLGTR